MVLGFRYTLDRHRGSVLPPIAIERTKEGVRVLAPRPSGRDQQILNSIRHEVVFGTAGAHIERGRVVDEWEIEIPRAGLPSFTAKSNQLQWVIETRTRSEGSTVEAEFELLVIPEEARA